MINPLVKTKGNITELPPEIYEKGSLNDGEIFRLPDGWETNDYILLKLQSQSENPFFKIFEDKYYRGGTLLIKFPKMHNGEREGEVIFDESLFEKHEIDNTIDPEESKPVKEIVDIITKVDEEKEIPIEEQDETLPELKEDEAKAFYTRFELENKYKEIGFRKFRKWVKEEFKVTGRSKNELIQDILDVQSGIKEVEL